MAHCTVLHIALCLLVLNSLCYQTLASSFKECTWKKEDGKDKGVIAVSHFPIMAFQQNNVLTLDFHVKRIFSAV